MVIVDLPAPDRQMDYADVSRRHLLTLHRDGRVAVTSQRAEDWGSPFTAMMRISEIRWALPDGVDLVRLRDVVEASREDLETILAGWSSSDDRGEFTRAAEDAEDRIIDRLDSLWSGRRHRLAAPSEMQEHLSHQLRRVRDGEGARAVLDGLFGGYDTIAVERSDGLILYISRESAERFISNALEAEPAPATV